jgi:hypothetical protein
MQLDDFFNTFEHILLSIEVRVADIYREEEGRLADHNVRKVYDGLIRIYEKEKQGKKPPRLKFTELEQPLFDSIHTTCEINLGRHESLAELGDDIEIETIELEDMITCLKRLRSSLDFWNKDYGRYGYLDYITKFI